MVKIKLIQGNVLEALKQIPDNSIDTIITSPPYWGLRKYPDSANVVWDGDPNCEHEFELEIQKDPMDRGGKGQRDPGGMGSIGQPRTWEKIPTKQGFCKKCGAWYGQLGLEPTLELYIKHLLQITKELKRVLKPTGVMFWNMGDCYANVQMENRQGYKIADDYIRLLGWIWTDGTIDKEHNTVRIYQTREQGIKEIERILNNLNLKYSVYTGKTEKEKIFYISAEERICEKLGLYSKEELPLWTKLLNREQLLILLDALLKGDGTIQKYSKELYGTKEKLEPIYQLFNENGLPCTLNQNSRGDWYIHFSQEIFNPRYLRAKCMALQNYRLILKMIDEQGWILRNSIVWFKPNHLPESCKDRFSRAYENVFMLVKSRKYFFNLDAVREPLKSSTVERIEQWIRNEEDLKDFSKLKPSAGNPNPQYVLQRVKASEEEMQKYDNQGKLTKHDIAVGRIGNFSYTDSLHEVPYNLLGKNPGDVWTINTEPFPEAHFATFPTELVRRCIKAGCPEQVCKKCGKPRKIITVTDYIKHRPSGSKIPRQEQGIKIHDNGFGNWKTFGNNLLAIHEIVGWASCNCNAGFEHGWILDPFVGSGTTIKVAIEERRNCIGIEIVPEYIEMAIRRCNLKNNPLIEFELKVI
jgi:DNA modification methylase